jgi:hypothetical protein
VRLPYQQWADDAHEKAPIVAGMLGMHRQRAKGMLLELHRAALGWGRKEDLPDGIVRGEAALAVVVAACDWEGDPARLQVALVTAGFLEVLADGLRVRGMSCYHVAFHKQEHDRERKRAQRSSGSPVEVQATSTRDTETETETEQKKKKKRAGDTPPPPGWKELVAALDRIFLNVTGVPCTWHPRDFVALKKLLQRGEGMTPSYIVGLWEHTLKTDRFVRDIHTMHTQLNRLASSWTPKRNGVALLSVDRPRPR